MLMARTGEIHGSYGSQAAPPIMHRRGLRDIPDISVFGLAKREMSWMEKITLGL